MLPRRGDRRIAVLATVLTVVIAVLTTSTGRQAGAQTPALGPGGTFLDDDRTVAEPSIEAIFHAGLTIGCAPLLFCPRDSVTRAEAATFLHRALSIETSTETHFPDVDPGAWYDGPVNALASVGILTGHVDGTFRPNEYLTRSQMAQLLVRALRISPLETLERFEDVPAEAPYADAIEALAASGITAGCVSEPPLFCPTAPVSRAEMAIFLTRALGLETLTPPDRIAPLNGLPVDGVAWNRRTVAVKIDDHRGARPQSGVDEADAIVETLVEGGLTRWIALFHQSDSAYLGPVRSVRPTDIGMVLPLSATVVASGGQAWILDQVAAAGVPVLRERNTPSTAMFRITARSAPHNVYTDTRELRLVADQEAHQDLPPPPLFVWGDLPDGQTATHISLQWSDPITVTWTWDGSRYRRWRDGATHSWVDESGALGQVSADTLVVLRAPLELQVPPAGATGSPVPVITTVGVGEALVFAEGSVVEGRWSRLGLADPFLLSTKSGETLTVPAGIPWVNVFPEGGAIDY